MPLGSLTLRLDYLAAVFVGVGLVSLAAIMGENGGPFVGRRKLKPGMVLLQPVGANMLSRCGTKRLPVSPGADDPGLIAW